MRALRQDGIEEGYTPQVLFSENLASPKSIVGCFQRR